MYPLRIPRPQRSTLGSHDHAPATTWVALDLPIHVHFEEHQIISRNGKLPPVNEISREDVIWLGHGESVKTFRRFRDFTGRYVTHCHNVVHEDHGMMFQWKIVP